MTSRHPASLSSGASDGTASPRKMETDIADPDLRKLSEQISNFEMNVMNRLDKIEAKVDRAEQALTDMRAELVIMRATQKLPTFGANSPGINHPSQHYPRELWSPFVTPPIGSPLDMQRVMSPFAVPSNMGLLHRPACIPARPRSAFAPHPTTIPVTSFAGNMPSGFPRPILPGDPRFAATSDIYPPQTPVNGSFRPHPVVKLAAAPNPRPRPVPVPVARNSSTHGNANGVANAQLLPFALEAIASQYRKVKPPAGLKTCFKCSKPVGLPACFREHHFDWCITHTVGVMAGRTRCFTGGACRVVHWEEVPNWAEIVAFSKASGALGLKGVQGLDYVLFPDAGLPETT